MSKGSTAFISFLSGAFVGSLFGILYAPDKGSNTRDRLTYRLDKYRERLQSFIEEFLERAEMEESLAKTQGDKVVRDAKQKAEKLLQDVDDLIGQIKGEQLDFENNNNN